MKIEQFNAGTPQSIIFMNEIHDYEIKSFSKTLECNPDLPKSSFSIKFYSKTQTLNTFYIKHILH